MDISNRLFFILILTVMFVACNQSGKKENISVESDEELASSSLNDDEKKITKIFYNVPSPVEMTKIMRQLDIPYNSEWLNQKENAERYITNHKAALNLGIYGADLSYNRLYDQIQESINYLAVIRELSDQLGIPQDEGSFAIQRLEDNINNKDSLLSIITDTYSNANIYLKENAREGTASLIILGGWIEGMYLALKMYNENQDNELLRRIGEQKFSVENLINLLKMHKENITILDEIFTDLQNLNSIYANIEITYDPDIVITNKTSKKTTIQSESDVSVTNEQINAIKNSIFLIRDKIIQ